MRPRPINEAKDLRNKDFFMEMAMKEDVVDIKLMHWTTERERDGEDSSDGGTLDHKAKCLMIVKAQALEKALSGETSFVSSDVAIRMLFNPEYPLTTSDILLRRIGGPTTMYHWKRGLEVLRSWHLSILYLSSLG